MNHFLKTFYSFFTIMLVFVTSKLHCYVTHHVTNTNFSWAKAILSSTLLFPHPLAQGLLLSVSLCLCVAQQPHFFLSIEFNYIPCCLFSPFSMAVKCEASWQNLLVSPSISAFCCFFWCIHKHFSSISHSSFFGSRRAPHTRSCASPVWTASRWWSTSCPLTSMNWSLPR